MESPFFWSDLRQRFERLHDPRRSLYGMEFPDGSFLLTGGPEDRIACKALHVQFTALAERAALAAELVRPGDGTPLDAWFRHLKAGPRYRPMQVHEYKDGAWDRELESGFLDDICLSSAEACDVLETEAYRMQHEAKRAEAPVAPAVVATERTGAPRILLSNRAKWLAKSLQARGWTRRDLERHGGPDARTLKRILAGHAVRATVLDKLANALSSKGRVAIRDIPGD